MGVKMQMLREGAAGLKSRFGFVFTTSRLFQSVITLLKLSQLTLSSKFPFFKKSVNK